MKVVASAVSPLPEKARNVILQGSDEKIKFQFSGAESTYSYSGTYEGLVPMLTRRYKESDNDDIREEIERFMTPMDCPDCKGRRLKPEALAVTVAGGRLYIGLDDFVTSALDRTAADSLATTPRFKAGLAAGGTDNTGVLFVDIAALRGNIEGMVPAAELSDYDANVKPFVEPLDYLMMVGRNDNGVGVSNVFLYVK